MVTAGGRLVADLRASGAIVETLPVHSKNPLRILRNRESLEGLAVSHGVSLIHARSRAPAWTSLWTARKLGLPFVTTFHGAYSAANTVKRWVNSSMIRGDVVIANSNFTRERILAHYGDQSPLNERIRVIARGVDLKYFDPRHINEDRLAMGRALWPDASHASLRLLMPARLSSWKGHALLINALGELESQIESGQLPNYQLVFLGGDLMANGDTKGPSSSVEKTASDWVQGLQATARQLGIDKKVHFAGHCHDMPAAYAASDGVINASTRPEAFGRIIVEAGAMARPVIAAAHGGALETVISGQTGELFDAGSLSSLAQCLARFLKQTPEERQRMGAEAHHHISKNFSIERMTTATLDVYRELLKPGGESI